MFYLLGLLWFTLVLWGISPGKFRAGKTGRASVANSNLNMIEWSTTYRAQDLETTNFESNGHEEGLIGIDGVDWDIKGNWDAHANPGADPPGLFPRDDGGVTAPPSGPIVLFTKVADAVSWNLPLWRCLSSHIVATATGLVTFDSSGKSNGTFTPPQGSV